MKNASPTSETRVLQSGATVSLGVNLPAGLIWYSGTLDPIEAPSYGLTSSFLAAHKTPTVAMTCNMALGQVYFGYEDLRIQQC